MTQDTSQDSRTPSPPFGYSRPCDYTPIQQLHLVAEFSVNKITPARIAYRTGIDIALIKALQSGEYQPERYQRLLAYYRAKRRDERLKKSLRKTGMAQSELHDQIMAEYEADSQSAATKKPG